MHKLIFFSVVIALAFGFAPSRRAQNQPYDLLFKNARIVDGSGNASYRGDVATRADTIVAVGPSVEGPAARVIDLQGQVIAPGFIDIHTHARRGIFEVPTADNYIRQGVTTLIEGPDGSSPVPIAPFLLHAAEVVLWLVEQGGCQGIFHAISEADLERILRHRQR